MEENYILVLIIFIVVLYVVYTVYNLGNRPVINLKTIIEYFGGSSKITKSRTTKTKLKDLNLHPRSKSEQEVISYLETATGKQFPTAYPEWLVWKGKNLELDGFNEELGVAMEFSGPLHTKWYPEKESYTKYFERVTADVVKIRLCKKHNIKFFTVDTSLPRIHWKNYTLSRLYDFGICDKPYQYIDIQQTKPFRNKELERELGLTEEYKLAKKL